MKVMKVRGKVLKKVKRQSWTRKQLQLVREHPYNWKQEKINLCAFFCEKIAKTHLKMGRITIGALSHGITNSHKGELGLQNCQYWQKFNVKLHRYRLLKVVNVGMFWYWKGIHHLPFEAFFCKSFTIYIQLVGRVSLFPFSVYSAKATWRVHVTFHPCKCMILSIFYYIKLLFR